MGKYQEKIPPERSGKSVYEYWAECLNILFKEHGSTKRMGRIEAHTVRHGFLARLKEKGIDVR